MEKADAELTAAISSACAGIEPGSDLIVTIYDIVHTTILKASEKSLPPSTNNSTKEIHRIQYYYLLHMNWVVLKVGDDLFTEHFGHAPGIDIT